MAGAKFTFEGLAELRADLRKLPAELTVQARREVEGAANGAAATIKAFYGQHKVTGGLRDSVTVTHVENAPLTARSVVRINSPLAWLFDNGSQARHYITAKGATHHTGAMWGKTPPTHIVARTASLARLRMHQQLKALLERHGAKVTEAA